MYDNVTAQYLKELNECKLRCDILFERAEERLIRIGYLQSRIEELESYQANFEHATNIEREEHMSEIARLRESIDEAPHATNCASLIWNKMPGTVVSCNCWKSRL